MGSNSHVPVSPCDFQRELDRLLPTGIAAKNSGMGKNARASQPPDPVITTDQEKTSMATKHAKVLTLTGKVCQLGKYSNNTEHHGADWESAWTFPFKGLMLLKEELNTLRQDKHCHASWFDIKGNVIEPMPWWGEESFAISQSFEAEELLIVVSGNRELQFLADDPDPDNEDDLGRPACVLSRLVLKPQFSGVTELKGAFTLRPGSKNNKALLEEHQHREVKITFSDVRNLEKRSKQQGLPLGQPADGAGDDAAATH